jgi:hypothetical protein
MRTLAATGVAILLAAYLAIPAVAQEVTCDNIAFDEQATLSYPAIRDACLDIIESEGARYAHFKLRVHREGYPSLMVRYQHRDGAWGPATLLTPPEGFKVNLDGRQVAVNDVPRGRELSIYLPEGRWEIAMTDADQLVIAEAEFAPVEFEVTAEELPEEVDMDAPTMAVAVDEADAEADETEAQEATEAEEAVVAEEAVDDADGGYNWSMILGLVAAFIIVWFLLRRRKARRTA